MICILKYFKVSKCIEKVTCILTLAPFERWDRYPEVNSRLLISKTTVTTTKTKPKKKKPQLASVDFIKTYLKHQTQFTQFSTQQ